jgi:hypothetical protein
MNFNDLCDSNILSWYVYATVLTKSPSYAEAFLGQLTRKYLNTLWRAIPAQSYPFFPITSCFSAAFFKMA